MTRIQTNHIKTEIAFDKLSAEYQIFNIKTTEKCFGKGANAAKIVDDLSNEKFVLSVVYERGNSFFALLKRDENNRINLDKAIRSSQDHKKISFEEISVQSTSTPTLLQLLLNSLGTYEGKMLGFHNVTGHFYIHHPSWIKMKGKQILSLELKITNDLVLDWNVRTFTCISEKNKIAFGKKKLIEYPEYVIGRSNTLKRIEKGSNPDAYILRQIEGEKNNIKFMDIQSMEKFDRTKMGVLRECLNKFNSTFEGMVQIHLDTFDGFSNIEIDTRMIRKMESRYNELANSQEIVLVDRVTDETSHIAMNNLKSALGQNFNCKKVTILKKPKKDSINIILIHEDEYYKDTKDPHDEKYKGCTVQHITIESVTSIGTSEKDWKSILNTIMHESLIKRDIEKKCISLVNWSDYKYETDIIFGLSNIDNNDMTHYYFMTIHPDGKCDFTEQKNDLFGQNEYQTCIDIFNNSDVVGVVKYGENINVIYNTKLITLPEIELIHERLRNGDNQMRNKTSRDILLTSVTDIKYFARNEYSLQYFSGIIGAGMKNEIAFSANIREVKTYRNSSLFFESLLQLMAVTFVRNGQLTVMPFPFKYLREYIELA